jgi:hypothetical protein
VLCDLFVSSRWLRRGGGCDDWKSDAELASLAEAPTLRCDGAAVKVGERAHDFQADTEPGAAVLRCLPGRADVYTRCLDNLVMQSAGPPVPSMGPNE